ncbi:MAG: adenosylhomocysteinase, partial [Nitrosotalea sp.]
SFSNQLLSMIYIAKNHKKIGKNVITVPQEIDIQIAIDALKAMNVNMDKPTAAQIKYGQSWA